MIVTDPAKLTELVDVVHDLFFDLEQVRRDYDYSTVTIHLYEDAHSAQQQLQPVSVLRVRDVVGIEIVDTEQIRYYDIEYITYEPSTCRIVIVGCVPLSVTLEVRALRLEVEMLHAI